MPITVEDRGKLGSEGFETVSKETLGRPHATVGDYTVLSRIAYLKPPIACKI